MTAFDIPPTTREAQDRATAPSASVFVSANAGSGKTFVLSRRVIRLLLEGVPPGRILCLTFTKAAAAEMSNRVFGELAKWATMDGEKLTGVLRDLEGATPSASRLADARRLFARALETPGGLKIQTIHGFCEALLQRFPFEANIAGRFEVIDERTEDEWLKDAESAVVLAAAEDPDSPLALAHARLTAVRSDDTVGSLVRGVVAKRAVFRRWLRPHPDLASAVATLSAALGCRPEESEATLAATLLPSSHLPPELLGRLLPALRASSPSDCKVCDRMEAAFAATDTGERIRLWRGVFFTESSGEARKRIVTKAINGQFPDLEERLAAEGARVEQLCSRLAAVRTRDLSAALLTVADAVLAGYERRKNFSAALDFEDLVTRAADLLQRSDAAAWVQYKLDQGIDHLLVDEAQDTSPTQWRVVEALTDDFFGGAGARGSGGRTLFAVGDEKQSIFSFQGAAPHLFDEVRCRTEGRVRGGRQRFESVRLDLSFRSVPDVVAAVDRVFSNPEVAAGLTADGASPAHTAARAREPGVVEIWPEFETLPPEEPDAWETPVDRVPGGDAAVRLAERVADTVAGWIGRGERLEGTGAAIRAGDVLVLVRRRDAFVEALNRALKAKGVPVAGADRLVLTQHIAIMDLIALARAMLTVEDDLTLATVMRSPLVGLEEDDLFRLAHGRGRAISLWQRLGGTADAYPEALRQLAEWRALAGRCRPYEFFATVLGRDAGRRRLRARLGPEVDDLLDEFLNLALAYERDDTPSLQGFLGWLEAGTREVKREAEAGRDEVRIMTVHGAKGLEAPIVFLVDHGQAPVSSSHEPRVILLGEDDGNPAMAPPLVVVAPKRDRPPAIEAALDAWRARAEAEYRRLLYVGMTRARDRLIVCGTRRRTPHPRRWHVLVSDALVTEAEPVTVDGEVTAWRWRAAPGEPRPPKDAPPARAAAHALPPWLAKPPAESAGAEPFRPSAALPARRVEGGMARAAARLRGEAMHRLLERLPDIEPARRTATAEAFLAAFAPTLAAGDRASLAAEAVAVLDEPRFAAVFSAASRAEVALTGLLTDPDGRPVRVDARIDRLLVEDDRVLIVDFKTERPPTGEPPEHHVAQLASYAELAARLYPGRAVEAALLYTAAPRLIVLPADRLLAMRRRLFAPA